MRSMRRTLLAVLILAASLLTVAFTAAPAAAQSKCTAAQYKAMAKKYLGKLKCHSKAVNQNVPVDAACLQNAEDKFALKWAAAVDKGDCLAVVSEAQGEGEVDTCVAAATALLETPAVCAEDGSATACLAYDSDATCSTCCANAGAACTGPCNFAVPICNELPDLVACAAALNDAGCADECCP